MSKPAPPLDWLSFPSPTVVEAPHPDLFEFELDNSLSAFDQAQVQVLALDYNDSYQFYRSETPHGPGSTVTVSSESAYETLSAYSESFYNYPTNTVDPQFARDLALDFSKFAVDSDNISNHGIHTMDPTRDGAFHSIQPSYEPAVAYVDTSAAYELAGIAGADGSLYPSATTNYVPSQGTVAPSNISAARGASSSSDSPVSSDGHHVDADPRKKYPCPSCSRTFARAYNLKTHLATHDANRLKPYVCSHRACGRSFSRKHDLGRHLVSIHRDETGSTYSVGSAHSESERKPVGLAADKGPRVWCDDCGRGWVGHQRACSCGAVDVK